MSPEKALTEESNWFAQSLRNLKDSAIEPDTLHVRIISYRPRIGHDLTCPKCWIKDGARSTLRSTPGTDEYDVLRCNYDACGAEFIVPF